MNRAQAFKVAIHALEYARARARVEIETRPPGETTSFALAQVDEYTAAINILTKELEARSAFPRKMIQ